MALPATVTNVIKSPTLQGGTDAAGMALFDPAALPEDFDETQQDDPLALMDRLRAEGRLYRFDTHADGGYALGVYESDRLPDKLQPFAKSCALIDPFHIPGGRLYFTGIEYAFQKDDSYLRKYSHMGGSVELTAGDYRMEVFEFDYPEDFHEDLLRQTLPTRQFRIHQLMSSLVPIGCISLLAVLASLAVLDWRTWARTVLPIGLSLLALPLILAKLPVFKQADRIYTDIQLEYPGYGILLQPVKAS